ncbi:uncharacterized protein ARMOST_19058 [Armillaria ostoyae]|uniref:Uncharacterized protein n=1 Tax=Armillaria ostoyae TaxID=47428 RepID=A0A284S3K9_ARMOS|nr:uncharacterized protein ARMOST_19058 [Armillaria ostoyae]
MFKDVSASQAYMASMTSTRPGKVPPGNEAAFNTLFESLCAAKETFDALHVFPSSPPTQPLAMISLTIAEDVVGGWYMRLQPSSDPSSLLPTTNTSLAVRHRHSDIVPSLQSRIGEVAKSPDRFYLVDAKSPGATWNVLWYHDGGLKGKLEKTKVNILKPGTSQLPMIFWEAIIYKQGPPVVPLSVLLLHKLKGWKDNMEPHLRSKYETDLEGIVGLLAIVIGYMSREEM